MFDCCCLKRALSCSCTRCAAHSSAGDVVQKEEPKGKAAEKARSRSTVQFCQYKSGHLRSSAFQLG